MNYQNSFKYRRYPKAVTLCAVRLYVRFNLSYSEVSELLAKRGVDVDRATIYRWVKKFGPEIDDSGAMKMNSLAFRPVEDEAYVKANCQWCNIWQAMRQQDELLEEEFKQNRDLSKIEKFLDSCDAKDRCFYVSSYR